MRAQAAAFRKRICSQFPNETARFGTRERTWERPGMSELVSMRTDGDVAVITIDNPPVNAMKHEVRARLLDLVSRAAGNPDVSAVVIACAGRTFVAGADITEFGRPPRQPT